MTIIDGLRKWLQTYAGLSDGRLGVDFLPEDARTYSVDAVPTDEIVRRYLDGSSRRQFLFTVSSREFFGDDIAGNIDTHAFYEALSAWLEAQNARRAFPDIGDGRRVESVLISTNAYPFIVDDHGTARYQIQLRLIYFCKGER